jgi:hypothetical protein
MEPHSRADNNPIIAALGELGFAQMHVETLERTIPNLTLAEWAILKQQLLKLVNR